MTYRVGNHQPQNVYRDDAYIGVMFTAEDAALVVEALNQMQGDLEDAEEQALTSIETYACPICGDDTWPGDDHECAPARATGR